MERTIRTDYYYYIYDNDQDDMVWYSPSSDDRQKCNRNLLNCIVSQMPTSISTVTTPTCAVSTKTVTKDRSPSAPAVNLTWSKRRSERRCNHENQTLARLRMRECT